MAVFHVSAFWTPAPQGHDWRFIAAVSRPVSTNRPQECGVKHAHTKEFIRSRVVYVFTQLRSVRRHFRLQSIATRTLYRVRLIVETSRRDDAEPAPALLLVFNAVLLRVAARRVRHKLVPIRSGASFVRLVARRRPRKAQLRVYARPRSVRALITGFCWVERSGVGMKRREGKWLINGLDT